MSDRGIGAESAGNAGEDHAQPALELRRLLDLTIAQIDHAGAEGRVAISALVELFTALHGGLQGIRLGAEAGEDPRQTAAHAADLEAVARNAIVQFQFYDRMTQRLAHASASLRACQEALRDPGAPGQEDWDRFWGAIRALYAMSDDRRLLDAVLDGASPDEALARLRQCDEGDEQDGVELF